MRRFLTRILVCLIPVVLATLVTGWAVNEYLNGRGGFRLGVDLVGGTILLYEVDESRMPQEGFKADELAAALKKRIDPADLYNITIRPVPTQPPRVEIILPTGGVFQAKAEQRNWQRLLDEIADNYGLVRAENDPLSNVPPGEVGALTETLVTVLQEQASREKDKEKAVPESREAISDYVQTLVRPGAGGGRRTLTTDKVEEIKSLIARQGRLEFRILANRVDDQPAIDAGVASVTARENQEQLDRLNRLGQPPSPPRNREDGTAKFRLPSMPTEPPHTYSWVELGKSELYSLGLNNDALVTDENTWKQIFEVRKPATEAETKQEKDNPKKWVEDGRKNPDMWTVKNPILDRVRALEQANFPVYVRKIPAEWGNRQPRDRDQGKRFEYFLLVRDPLPGQEISGDYLTKAAAGHDQRGKPSIEFTFNAEGGSRFWDVTSKNKPSSVGEGGFKRHLAIIFDQQIVSAPTLNEPIRTNGQITGNFSMTAVTDMVRILRAGALPATLKKDPVSQSSMGSTLGADTIYKGTLSVGIAFLAVMAFMMVYYRFAGIVACVALLANLLLTVAFMVMVDAAFTLPGLAGLVLMLGMAVDANVLIYERLREEQDKGANLALALRNGYDRAFPTIIDTHLSSIFTAIVLYVVGNDQLKGFGISLTVGLIISLFTSLYMTRTIFEIWLHKGWFTHIHFMKLKFGPLDLHHPHINFMGIRYKVFALTVVVSVLGLGLFLYRLPDPGARASENQTSVLNIDFTGGTAYTAILKEGLDLGELREKLEGTGLPDLSIEQVFLSSDTTGAGKSKLFTVRTSETRLQKVRESIESRMKGLLEQEFMEVSFDRAKPGQQARLTFWTERDGWARSLDAVARGDEPKAAGDKVKEAATRVVALKLATGNANPLRSVPPGEEAEVVKQLDKLLKDRLGKQKGLPSQEDLAEYVRARVKEWEGHVSTEQVRRLIGEVLAAQGQVGGGSGRQVGFSIERDAHNRDKDGRYSRMTVVMNEPIGEQRFSELLLEGKKGSDGRVIAASVRELFNTNPQPERLENFDPQLAESTQQRALYAIVASWAAILLYLWFRFGNWTFGAAAVICLIHDVCFTLGWIALAHYLHGTWFGYALGIHDFKIDLPAVAAILTLVGYSVNDTIVVFDRIREVRGKNPLLTEKMINDSINQTLSRTVLASLTVFLVVLVLYIFGGEGVKLFAFTMVVGVVIGTISSIYVASPLLLLFGEGATPEGAGTRAPETAGTAG